MTRARATLAKPGVKLTARHLSVEHFANRETCPAPWWVESPLVMNKRELLKGVAAVAISSTLTIRAAPAEDAKDVSDSLAALRKNLAQWDTDYARRYVRREEELYNSTNPVDSIDQTILNYIFFNPDRAGYSAAYAAYAETFLRVRQFRSPSEALLFFDERRDAYNKALSAGSLDDALRGFMKSGMSLGLGVFGLLDSRGPASAGPPNDLLDFVAATDQMQRVFDRMDFNEYNAVLRSKFLDLDLQTQLNPFFARPLLKEIMLGDPNAPDASYLASALSLPATKSDVARVSQLYGGAIISTFPDLEKKIDELTSKISNAIDIDAVKSELSDLKNAISSLTESTADISENLNYLLKYFQDVKKQKEFNDSLQSLQSDAANCATTLRNLGKLLGWDPAGTEVMAEVVSGAAEIAVGYFTDNPWALAAGISTVAAALFGPHNEQTDLDPVILQAISSLFDFLNVRMDRLEHELSSISSQISECKLFLRQTIESLSDQLRQVQQSQLYSRAIILKDINEVKELIYIGISREFEADFVTLSLAALQCEKSFYGALTYRDENDRLRKSILRDQLEQQALAAAARYSINFALNQTGLGHPKFVGSVGDHSLWLDQQFQRNPGYAALEEKARAVALSLRTGSLGNISRDTAASCFVITDLIVAHIPVFQIAEIDRNLFEDLPVGISKDLIVTGKPGVSQYDPATALRLVKEVRQVLDTIPNTSVRAEAFELYVTRLSNARQIYRLYNSPSGIFLLLTSYSELIRRFYALLAHVFVNPVMRDAQVASDLVFRDILHYRILQGFDALEEVHAYDLHTDMYTFRSADGRVITDELVSAFAQLQNVPDLLDIIFKPFLRDVASTKHSYICRTGISRPDFIQHYNSSYENCAKSFSDVADSVDARLDNYLTQHPFEGKPMNLEGARLDLIDLALAVRVVELLIAEKVELARRICGKGGSESVMSWRAAVYWANVVLDSLEPAKPYLDAVVRSAGKTSDGQRIPVSQILFPQVQLAQRDELVVNIGSRIGGAIVASRPDMPDPRNGEQRSDGRFLYCLPAVLNPKDVYPWLYDERGVVIQGPRPWPVPADEGESVVSELNFNRFSWQMYPKPILGEQALAGFRLRKMKRMFLFAGSDGANVPPVSLIRAGLDLWDVFKRNIRAGILYYYWGEPHLYPNSQFALALKHSSPSIDELTADPEYFAGLRADKNNDFAPQDKVLKNFLSLFFLCSQPVVLVPTQSRVWDELDREIVGMQTEIKKIRFTFSTLNDLKSEIEKPSYFDDLLKRSLAQVVKTAFPP